MKKKFFKAVLLTALVAGSFDALAACIQYYIKTGNNPAKVFRYIASGAFSKAAFAKNLYSMAGWGLLFHFLIAMSFTLIFYLFYRRVKMLVPDKYLTAVLFGLFVWAVMNLLVVPVTFGTEINIKIPDALIAAGILITAIGLPVSLMADRYYSKNQNLR